MGVRRARDGIAHVPNATNGWQRSCLSYIKIIVNYYNCCCLNVDERGIRLRADGSNFI